MGKQKGFEVGVGEKLEGGEGVGGGVWAVGWGLEMVSRMAWFVELL